MALDAHGRGTDVTVEVVARSDGSELAFLDKHLDIVEAHGVDASVLGLDGIAVVVEAGHIEMMGIARGVHQIRAEIADSFAEFLDRCIPRVSFFIRQHEMSLVIIETFSIGVDEEGRNRCGVESSFDTLLWHECILDRVSLTDERTEGRDGFIGVRDDAIVGMGMNEPG